MMTDIREYLAHKPLLFDGGMAAGEPITVRILEPVFY